MMNAPSDIFNGGEGLQGEGMNYYIIRQWIAVGPGRGYWYECRRVKALSRDAAITAAFSGNGLPFGYKVELA